uniref:Uncharacterized protein n=1 Tax=Meloidogyne enterolobii TaxID=390850 RepID=A0A6V7VXP7_MELEN|nr:unnamed protein product [Meloidogyne enterolobii]
MDIQSNYGAFEGVMLAKAQTIDDHAEITEEIEQIKNVKSVAKIPEEFKKYFASISGFNEEIELSREQFYGAELIRLDLMGKTSKPTLKKTLSSLSPISSSKNLFRSSSSKSVTTSSSEPSAIEKYIKNHDNPELKVRIYMKVKCGYKHKEADFFAKEVVYKINYDKHYTCNKCKKIYMNNKDVYHSPAIQTFKLPSLERTIQNPILQNGNGLGFTYEFDFAQQKQDMSINLNFVQLVDLPPNNLHNESTSSHVPEYGYETPTHPTNVSTNFQNLNLRDDEDGSESETERPNYAAMAEGQGIQLNFDEASNSSGSSGKKSRGRPPKHVSPQTTHGEAQQISMQKRPQRKLTTTRSMPVERGSSNDLNDSGHSSNNAGHAHNDAAAMHHAGGMGQFQGYGQSQQWPPSEYPPAYYGYNQAMFGHHPSFDNANMHANFGGQKTYYRSESMPVDHQNGGGYTGSHPYSPSSSSYWTDTSSDYSSSQTSLSGPGNDSMNIRENVILGTQPGYQQFDSSSGSHSYGGNNGSNNDGNNGRHSWNGHNGGESWNDHIQNHQMNQQWNETGCQEDDPGCHIM